MLENENKGRLIKRLNELKKDISQLRKELDKTDAEKRDLITKIKSSSIPDLLKKAKYSKEKRNELTSKVRKTKEEREEVDSFLKKKNEEIKKLIEDAKKVKEKGRIKGNPLNLNDELEMLELKIQTDALPFEKEKQIMKKINELKKKKVTIRDLAVIEGEIKKKKKELNELTIKKKEERLIIEVNARESQKKHEEMLELFKAVDEVRAKEKEVFEKLKNISDSRQDLNLKLKDRLNGLNKISSELEKHNKEIQNKKKEEEILFLKSKKSQIEDKIKKGGKLTTEDLLVLQKLDE